MLRPSTTLKLTETAAFGANYIPGLSQKSNTPAPVLEALETLATMSWLSVIYKHGITSKEPERIFNPDVRMQLVAAKIPRMLHPNHPPYGIPATLPELNKEEPDDSLLDSLEPDSLLRFIQPDTIPCFSGIESMRTLAIYAMMGLRAPGNMWSNLLGYCYRSFLKINGAGHGHIFSIKSRESKAVRVVGSYEPPGVKGVIYLFFPTSGEHVFTDADYVHGDQYNRIEHRALGMNTNVCNSLCDVRRFIFE